MIARRTGILLVAISTLGLGACPTAPNSNMAPVVTDVDVQAVPLVTGLDSPWSFAFLPDGSILITERGGSLVHLDGSTTTTLGGVPSVVTVGQGGLLDVVIDPDYATDGWLYLSYAADLGSGYGVRVARARLSGTALSDVGVIFESNTANSGGVHFGSRLAFGDDGKLYVTLGERGTRDQAQDTLVHPGSIVRLNPDGTIPTDNPYTGDGGVADEIYTYGHRNPQGLALNPTNGELWAHEHGPQGGDEVNILSSGANYGWPEITYGTEYGSGDAIGGTTDPGMEQPLVYYVPTSIAPSGMAFYTGSVIPAWHGDLFIGALAGQHLRRLILDGDNVLEQEVLFDGSLGRIRDVRMGPDGYLYLVTDSSSATLYRVEPQP